MKQVIAYVVTWINLEGIQKSEYVELEPINADKPLQFYRDTFEAKEIIENGKTGAIIKLCIRDGFRADNKGSNSKETLGEVAGNHESLPQTQAVNSK